MFKGRIMLPALAALAFAFPVRANEVLELDQAYELVLRQNPQVQIYKAKVMAAEGNRLQQSLSPNPEAIFEIENFGGDEPRDGLEETEYTLGLQQQIETAGKRSKREGVASYEKEQARQEALAGIQAMLAQTKAAYMRVAIAKERLNLADKRTALAEQTHETVKKRIGAAKSAEIQHTKVDIEQSSADVEMRRAETEIFAAEAALANLMGAEKLDYEVEADLTALPELPEREAIIEALEKTPMSAMSRLAVTRQEVALDLARANAVPDPTLGLGVRRFAENDGSAFLASLSIPIPVFNHNQGAIAEAKSNLLATEAEKQRQRLDLNKQATEIWHNLATAREEVLVYQQKILPSAQKAYGEAEYGFNQGAFTFLDLLDAQRTVFDVQEQYLKALSDFYAANAQIDLLAGTYADMAGSSFQSHSNEGIKQ